MKSKGNGVFEVNESDGNIYLIGDLHGDYQCMIHSLVDLCKVCVVSKIFNDSEFSMPNREYLEWEKGNNSIIIFCGDIMYAKLPVSCKKQQLIKAVRKGSYSTLFTIEYGKNFFH